jgi:predicted Rossmann-fold nucleotide-binding protein
MEAHAIALFPGGFGTHDEAFEALTLLQTGKSPPMPLVLVELPGEGYWESWDRFIRDQMLRRGFISKEDLSLYKIVHSPEEGVEWICNYYSTYHSMRRVRNRLVIRLERELTNDHIRELNGSFQDLIREGNIEKLGPFQ